MHCVSHCIDFNLGVISCTIRRTVRPTMKILERSRSLRLEICKSLSKNNPVTIHDGNRPQSYFNPDRELPLTIRICDIVIWEYGNGGKFSFIIFLKTHGIASAFYYSFTGDTIRKRFLISNVSAGNMLPASYRLAWLITYTYTFKFGEDGSFKLRPFFTICRPKV
jgi:hypothetical protein